MIRDAAARRDDRLRRLAPRPCPGMRTSIRTTSGCELGHQRDGLLAVAGLAHDLEIRLGVEDHAEAHPQQLLVVDEQDAGRHDRRAGPIGGHGERGPASRRRVAGPAWTRAVVDRRALAHAAQAGAVGRSARRGGPLPVSTTSTSIASSARLTRHPRSRRRAGVLERVGQRLLDDAVDRQLQAGRERRSGLPVSVVAHREARPRGRCSTSSSIWCDPGLRGELARGRESRAGRRAAGASRSVPGARCATRCASPAWPARDSCASVARAVGERDHHGDVVGDHVVHLARDPRPLRGGRQLAPAGRARARAPGVRRARAARRASARAVADADARAPPAAVARPESPIERLERGSAPAPAE